MYVEHTLGLTEPKADDLGDDNYDVSDERDAAIEFLKARPTAKILVIIDTHCLENGYFTYVGDDAVSLQGCSLLEVCLSLDIMCGLHLTCAPDLGGLPP